VNDILVIGGAFLYVERKSDQSITRIINEFRARREQGQQINNCAGEWTEDGDCVERELVLTAPVGGEILCIGEEYDIAWEAPAGVDLVSVHLSQPRSFTRLITVRATENGSGPGSGKYTWPVTLPQNRYSYVEAGVNDNTFKIFVTSEGVSTKAGYSDFITIKECRD